MRKQSILTVISFVLAAALLSACASESAARAPAPAQSAPASASPKPAAEASSSAEPVSVAESVYLAGPDDQFTPVLEQLAAYLEAEDYISFTQYWEQDENCLAALQYLSDTGEMLYSGDISPGGLPNGQGLSLQIYQPYEWFDFEDDMTGKPYFYTGGWKDGLHHGQGFAIHSFYSVYEGGVDGFDGYCSTIFDGAWESGVAEGYGRFTLRTEPDEGQVIGITENAFQGNFSRGLAEGDIEFTFYGPATATFTGGLPENVGGFSTSEYWGPDFYIFSEDDDGTSWLWNQHCYLTWFGTKGDSYRVPGVEMSFS